MKNPKTNPARSILTARIVNTTRRPYNSTMTLKKRKTAVSSLLLGLAVGDAIGVPVEFRPRDSFHVTGMQGYGTHNQPPGTWSDDGNVLDLLL
jgi:hypothetical protein